VPAVEHVVGPPSPVVHVELNCWISQPVSPEIAICVAEPTSVANTMTSCAPVVPHALVK